MILDGFSQLSGYPDHLDIQWDEAWYLILLQFLELQRGFILPLKHNLNKKVCFDRKSEFISHHFVL